MVNRMRRGYSVSDLIPWCTLVSANNTRYIKGSVMPTTGSYSIFYSTKFTNACCGVFIAIICGITSLSYGRGIEMDPIQFRDMIIIPTLQEMDTYKSGMYSDVAVILLLGTALVESNLTYLKQNKGPALGVYQIEPKTADDVMARYIMGKPSFHAMFEQMIGGHWSTNYQSLIVSDLKFATMVARIRYWMEVEPLGTTLEDAAAYWNKHYNTNRRKGTDQDFIRKYKANT